jgi:hypothetical protein
MLTAIGKYVGGKVVTILCLLGAGLAGLWFWRHPEDLRTLWTVIRLALTWIAFAAALPWATFPLMPRLVRMESNAAGAILLAVLAVLDVLAALWLAGWHVGGALAWTVVLVGWITASAYNYVICESLARYVDR